MVKKWEESERWQEQRWTTVTATFGHIVDDVQELLDGLVPEEKEKGNEKGVETEVEEMEMEEVEETGAERDRREYGGRGDLEGGGQVGRQGRKSRERCDGGVENVK